MICGWPGPGGERDEPPYERDCSLGCGGCEAEECDERQDEEDEE
jgi:hypothetical protein